MALTEHKNNESLRILGDQYCTKIYLKAQERGFMFMSQKAIRILDNQWPQKPCEFSYSVSDNDEVVGMKFMSPDGEIGVIKFDNHPQASQDEHWTWDKNIESPTIKPSLDLSHIGGWHGYLTNGAFRPA